MTRRNYIALAIDGDGTLLRSGHMGRNTIAALKRWRKAGRKLLLATGENVKQVADFPHADLFDRIVAENGARSPAYNEKKAAAAVAGREVAIAVDVGVGKGKARVWTCDLTEGYIRINGSYRS